MKLRFSLKKIQLSYLIFMVLLGWFNVYLLLVASKVDGLQVSILQKSHEVLEEQRTREGKLPDTMMETDIRSKVDGNTISYIPESASTYRIYANDGNFNLAIDQNGKFTDFFGNSSINHFLLNYYGVGGNIFLFLFLAFLPVSLVFVFLSKKSAPSILIDRSGFTKSRHNGESLS